jgi:glutamate 5-kinase
MRTVKKHNRETSKARRPGLVSKAAPRETVAAASRIVVKVGTNVIMRDDGSASIGVLYGIAESLANLRRAGREVLLVSSGAVGLGAQRLALPGKPSKLGMVQACAAVGQSRLMSLYDDAFDKLGYRVAQILLTEEDFLDPKRHENLRVTLETLLKLGVIPIINENDTVSTAELDSPNTRVFGDNDKLSALVLRHIGADLLILLSDVDGLYTSNPQKGDPQKGHPQNGRAMLIPEINGVTDAVRQSVRDAARAMAKGGNGRGRGGMETKLEAARIANEAGCPAIIANGRTPAILDLICAGRPAGTLILSVTSSAAPEKRP